MLVLPLFGSATLCPPAGAEPTVDASARRWIDGLSGRTLEEREAACLALARLGPGAIPWLQRSAHDPDERVQIGVSRALAAIGGRQACEALLDGLEHAAGSARMAFLDALIAAGGPARLVIEERGRANTAPSAALRLAQRTMLRLEVEARLDRLITSGNEYGYYTGQFDAVAKLGPEAVPLLWEIGTDPACRLQQQHPYRRTILRTLALWALGDMGDRSVVPGLRRLYESSTTAAELGVPQEEVEDGLAWVLQQLDDRAPMAALLHRLERQLSSLGQEYYGLRARLASLHYRARSFEGAERHYLCLLQEDPRRSDWACYCLACLYALQNRTRDALRYLKQSIQRGYPDLEWMQLEGDLRSLHGNAEYEDLMREAERKNKHLRR